MTTAPKQRAIKATRVNNIAGQFAALAYQITERGEIKFALTKTRDTAQWGLPKGHPMPGKDGARVAQLETKQEVGITGVIVHNRKPIGSFRYNKATYEDGIKIAEEVCWVNVYLLHAKAQLFKWKEKGQRKATWMTKEQAVSCLASNKNILANEARIRDLLQKAEDEIMKIEKLPRRKLLRRKASSTRLDAE